MAVWGDISRVNSNINAFQALDAFNAVNRDLAVTQLRLATGKRINSAEEDASGYVIGKNLEARARGLSVALANVGDAKNVMSIAEGGLNSVMDILMTMKEKATQAASDTLGTSERGAIENQLDDLASEIDAIVSSTQFNGTNLIDGTYTSQTWQVGEGTSDTMSVSISQDHDGAALSVADSDLDVSSASAASTAISSVDAAIDTVASTIRSVGSIQSRLSVKEDFLSVAITNTEAAKSRIFDADLAKEQVKSISLQILQQTTVSALAQANVAPQAVLGLLG